MNADLMIDGNADDGSVGEASDDVGLFRRRQELETGDERRMGFLDSLQFLKYKFIFILILFFVGPYLATLISVPFLRRKTGNLTKCILNFLRTPKT